MRRKCFGNKVEDVWMENGKGVCTACHPNKPNWDGRSRGRKIHLAKDDKMTVCNMLVDEYIPDRDRNWSMVDNGRCKICFSNNIVKGVSIGMLGKVKWFNDKKGYGFISGDDGKDYFVHYSEIQDGEKGQKNLTEGEEVEFDVQQTNKGVAAKNVKTV